MLNKINEVKNGRENSQQKQVISNLEKFYKSRDEIMNLFRGYTKMVFEGKYKARHGTWFKILTLKQRLPMALAQVKAVNDSENLLNETEKFFIFSFNQKITKKMNNNIIKSLPL